MNRLKEKGEVKVRLAEYICLNDHAFWVINRGNLQVQLNCPNCLEWAWLNDDKILI